MGQRQTSKVTMCSQCGRCWYETCLIFFQAIIKAELSNAEEFLRWISSSLLTLLSRIRKRVSNKHSPTNHLWLKFAAVHLPDTLADSLGCCFTFCFWQFCGRKPLADEKNQVINWLPEGAGAQVLFPRAHTFSLLSLIILLLVYFISRYWNCDFSAVYLLWPDKHFGGPNPKI